MFVLESIENGRTQAPDPVWLERSADVAYSAGTALVIYNGKAATPQSTMKPTHICLSNVKAGDGEILLAYYITPAMVFEVPLSDYTADNLVIGKKVDIAMSGQRVTSAIPGSVATIVDTCGAKAVGDKILVRFE
ncbi:MAG: hypothetical protein ACI3YK_01705 [Eubacteriales bacterium]